MAVQINVAANQAALTASIQAGVQAYNQRFAQNNQLNLTVNQRAFSQPLGRMTGDVKDFEAALAASNARVIAFGASTAVLGGVIRSFKELASVTIDVEKNLADINRVFGLSTSQLQKFSTELFNVGKQTASTFDDASKAALEFSRQGLKAEDVLTRTKDALTLTRLAGIGTANAVDALTSTVNGFAATGVTTTQILNKLVAVEQDYAVGAGDLAEALSRTGQAAQEAGVSLDQLNALVTAAQQSTARGGAVIGNALKTIFTRLQRTETLDQLEAFDIAVRDVQGNILPAVTILQNFAGAYKKLGDAQRAQLSEQVAGVYQVNILKAIVGDLNKSQGVYAGALQRGAAATNEAEIATAKLNQTLDALLKQTATSTQQLANNIGKVTFEPLAKYGTEQLKSFVESMNEILEGEGVGSTFANGLLKGIRNVIAGPGAIAAFFTLFKLIQNSFTYLSQALPQIAGITTETQNRKNIEQSILQIMQQQGPASQALAGMMGNQAAQAQLLLQIARQQTAEYQMQSTLAKQLAAQLATQGVRVKGSGGLQVTRAGGYIPAATRMAEVVGAQAGGYAPGRVVSSPVGGVMNTAEDVKYIPGFAQPFINPPAGSKAGRAHRQNAISRTGVDPYMNSGFIPNFAITGLAAKDFDKEGQGEYKILAGRIFESLLRGESYLSLTENKVKADVDIGKYAIREAKLSGKAAYNDPNFGDGKLKGRYLILPKTASTDYDQRLEQNKNADIFRAPYTHANLFARSKKIIEREKKNKTTDPSNIPLFDGFIPNFATPMTTASIPWFKKYSSKYKNAAGDADLFKMGDFPTYGRGSDHEYAKKGNANMLSYLHEDFVRSALNIALGSKQVIRPSEVGFRDKPISDIANENDFDLLYRIADGSYSMLELKQDFRNISGSVTGFMNKKLANLEKENPVLAKKVSSMIAVSNRPKFTDPTGRNAGANFSEFEMAAASIVKDKYSNVDPSISTKLTKVTDGLLRRYEAKKNTTYDGFIPNFAYKQAVMGLEESMSGNKAIFDTKPFPHIRNSSQPTFSSAISDHGGLGNALSDSMRGQKAAGLMNKGFIPNFVKYGPSYSYMPSGVPSGSSNYYPSGNPNKSQAVSPTYQAPAAATNATFQQNDIDKALQDFINSVQAADQKLGIFESTFGGRTKIIDSELVKLKNTLSKGGVSGSKLNEALDNASKKINSEQTKLGKALEKSSTTLAIAGPLIAGQLEQLFFANKKRTELSETERAVQSGLSTGLTSISTGVSIGATFGPLGAGIGAATGALVGLTSALSATKLSAEELADLNQEQAQKAQANISAASSYIEAQKSLTQMIASGASSSDIENASKKLAVNFKEIEDVKLQEIFNSTGGDVKKMTEELQKYSNEISRRSAFQKGIIEKSDVKTTVQALSIGIPKQNKKDVVEGFRKAALFSQSEMQYEQAIKQAEYGSNRKNNEGKTYKEVIDEAEKFRKENIASSLENFIPRLLDIGGITKDDPQYKSEFDNALKKFKSLPPEKLKEIADNLEKADLVSGVSQSINRLNNVATKSFNQIFLEIEQRIAKTAFDISLNFERDSGQRRIQSAALDFITSFQDSINSFLSNNLPDARKFDFTAATAGQKAQLQLQKSQQDYDKAIAEQANERSMFLNKSTKDLTETFKSSFLPSQASAQFFQQNVLSQLESGTFAGDAKSLAKQMQTKAFTEAQAPVTAAGFNLNDINNVDAVLKQITDKMEAVSTSVGATSDEYIKLESALRAIQELQKQTALYTNDNDVKKLQNAVDAYMNEKALFDLKQANAKKELEINKQLNEARIAVEKDIAIEKAKVDKANLARMESMKNLSATIGNRLDISKAESGSRVAAFQRQLNDPTQTYGMGTAQITERRIKLQSDILKEQRTAEDQAINAEIQQRMLEMAAEQENTAATLKLNETIMDLVEIQLRGQLGGQENINDIRGRVNEMGEYAQKDIDLKYGAGTYAQYQALQRIEESRTASAANNPIYNSKTFEDAMAKAGFNNVGGKGMSELEQRNFLSAEQLKAEQAGNVVLANTIRRYREQIDAKQQVLNITRKQIDADVQLQATTDRQLSSIRGRVAKGFGELNDEGDKLILNLGENLPRMFADGMVNGIKAAIKESDNLGDALMGVAASFLDSISTTLMQAGTYKILGSLGIDNLLMKQSGGLIRAQSGMYVSGTGSGDKYPAMLENGEYVLNRRAVMAMGGPAALDTLNFSMAPRFASGGSFNAELDDIKAMEDGMTTFGLENSSYYKELRDAEIQRAEQARQKKRARQAQTAQMVGSLVASVATVAIGAGLQNVASNMQAKAAEKMVQSGTGAIASAGLSTYGDTPQLYAETGLSKAQVSNFQKYVKSGYISPTGMSTIRTPRTGFGSILPPRAKGRQTGGLIGSRLSDTIPGYMEGGLYNSPIVKQYGAGMQGGGMSSVANNSNTVNNSNASNSFNFNTTVNRDGNIQMGANSTSYKQQDVELSNNLNNRIYGAVLDVIRDQQRFGGSLAGTRKA